MPNENEDVILNDNNEGENLLNDAEVDENFKKSLATEIARKKHFREKSEKESNLRKELEIKTKSLEEKLAKLQTRETPEISSRVEQLESQLAKSKFARTHGYNDEETDLIHSMASGLKVSPEQAKDNPYIKTAIETVRSQKRAEANTPGSSTTISLEGGKKWDEMDKAEQQKNFPNFVEQLKNRKK